MEITLHNIGVIQDASIKLDGLTVITGKNESGKTTVGKALYALLDAVSDLPQKAKKDRDAYIWKHLQEMISKSSRIFIMIEVIIDVFSKVPEEPNLSANFPSLKILFDNLPTFFDFSEVFDAEAFVRQVKKELKTFYRFWEVNASRVTDENAPKEFEAVNLFLQRYNFSGNNSLSNQILSAIQFLEKLFVEIDRDPQLIHYTRESVNQTLNVEFANQIQPINGNAGASCIRIAAQDTVYFDLHIEGNRVANDGFFNAPFSKAYFMDNPFVLDQAPFGDNLPKDDSMDADSYFNPNTIQGHAVRLSRILHSKQRLSVLEKTILDENLRPVKAKIDEVIPGTFDFSQTDEYYVRKDGSKLRVSNMAAGSKMFSIIKILLDKGLLDEDAMLILDEPETHLHPQWQNQFAEMIVLLVKELHVKVLLTTHSSNFMLAIDAYMRKHNINDIANFYQARRLDNGYATHDCVNDCMEVIYQDFFESFSAVKVLRDEFCSGGDDEA